MNFIEDSGPGCCGDVRNAVLGHITENNFPMAVATKALCQSLEFLRDVGRIHSLAAELGLESSGFRSNATLALYWDVRRDGRDIGFIYRGWEDPGFVVGECVPVLADEMPVFMAQANAAVRLLATNGLALTTEPLPGGGFCLNMTAVIYAEGFNAGSLAGALGAIGTAARTVRDMVA